MADKRDDDKEREPAPGFRVNDRRRIHLEDEGNDGTAPMHQADEPDEHMARHPEVGPDQLQEAAGASMGEDTIAQAHQPTDRGGTTETVPEPPTDEAMDTARDLADEAAKGQRRGAAPPVDFVTFILSLASSALVHLGDTPHPETGRTELNLPMAKQTIDMLSMLRDKTRGNLEDDEQRYMDALLYDLRLRFVDVSRDQSRPRT